MKNIFINSFLIFLFIIKIISAEDINSVEIISDELQWNEKDKIAHARGNASAQNKEKKIKADELIVFLSKENNITIIEAKGNVIFYNLSDEATGDHASYNLVENNISITGNVTLKREENIMHGEFLELDLDTGISSLSKGKSGEKVRMLFSTNKKDSDNGE